MKRVIFTALLAAILVTGAVIAHAQRVAPLPSPTVPGSGDPAVITGADLGFRLLRMDGNRAVGELVIRQNVPAGGTIWVPVDLGGGRGGVHPLTLQ